MPKLRSAYRYKIVKIVFSFSLKGTVCLFHNTVILIKLGSMVGASKGKRRRGKKIIEARGKLEPKKNHHPMHMPLLGNYAI